MTSMIGLITILVFFFMGSECWDSGTRILNGEEADVRDYPFYGLVVTKSHFYVDMKSRNTVLPRCGANLISPRYFLTAYHCMILKPDPSHFVVMMGMNNLCAYGNKVMMLNVEEIIPHPEVKVTRKEKKNDIALMKIYKEVTNVEPIKLPLTPPAINEMGHVIGFGLIKIEKSSGNYEDVSCVLRKANQMVPDQSLCIIPKDDIKGHFCTIDPYNKNATACRGDSGGPWLAQRQSGTTLLGISSFGDPLCRINHMNDYYTNVFLYVEWILENIGEGAKESSRNATIPTVDSGYHGSTSQMPVKNATYNESSSIVPQNNLRLIESRGPTIAHANQEHRIMLEQIKNAIWEFARKTLHREPSSRKSKGKQKTTTKI